MFAAEFETADTNGRRRSPRAPVSFDVQLGRGGLDRTLCKVADVSRHGARLQTYTAMRKGSTIWLTLPRLGQIAADVMWADDFTAGCQFRTPLTEAQFAQLLDIQI